ncbi:hypothetical protein QQZ08_009226 [Neonectria magnoliae]|uniref:Xylanolytic transcriptional activator regulatory domain-containing protein n=1 Tax=Neonectria magnoliae TaxID=2732573 RepID=A0ABR1HQ41_9HYPO
MVHQGRYCSWAEQESPSPARASLRFAMWTLAAAFSAQFQSLGDKLHAATCQMLHGLEGNDHGLPWATGEVQLEQIQAWLLLAYYELIRMERDHGQRTAARVFRLVQLAHLHAVDAFNLSTDKDSNFDSHDLAATDDTWVIVEEKRRTFWLAFCFDRLLNAHDSLSFTLHEEVIYLRLPAPEASFRDAQLGQTEFLGAVWSLSHSPALDSGYCYFWDRVKPYGFNRVLETARLAGCRRTEANAALRGNRAGLKQYDSDVWSFAMP